MRYRLRTLLVLTIIGPPAVAYLWWMLPHWHDRAIFGAGVGLLYSFALLLVILAHIVPTYLVPKAQRPEECRATLEWAALAASVLAALSAVAAFLLPTA